LVVVARDLSGAGDELVLGRKPSVVDPDIVHVAAVAVEVAAPAPEVRMKGLREV
jgi:hypothetical protein